MSEENTVPAGAAAQEYVEVWAESMGQVVGQIAGAAIAVQCLAGVAPEITAPAETDMNIVAVAGGGLRGEMSFRLPRNAVLALAQAFLGEPQEATAEFKPDHSEAVEELFRQIAGHVATALKPRWDEVQLHVGASAVPSWPAAAEGWMVFAPEAPLQLSLEWKLSAALAAALRPAPVKETTPPNASADLPAAEAPPAPAGTSITPGSERLGMFMDVELDVTLRFGGRHMVLRQVLELGPGAVVELDREIQQPVDLLLDGRLIARGEVVVVDGNYGLRVLEVVGTPAA